MNPFGMDKLGHIYTSNAIVKNISSLYTWAGVNKNTSLAIGSGVAFGFLTTLEVLDGFSDKWGFSWSDVGANALGIAWYVWQDLLWEEQRLKLKFSAYPSKYARYRPNTLGNNFSERILKDYNGQTYWLSESGIAERCPLLSVVDCADSNRFMVPGWVIYSIITAVIAS